jgi:hypothetical protein
MTTTGTGVPPQDLETKSVPEGHGAVAYSEADGTIQPAHVTTPTGDQGGTVGTRDENEESDETDS